MPWFVIVPWISAFAFTQAVEVPIYLFAAGRDFPDKASLLRRFVVAFGASAITHPIVWFVIPLLVPDYRVMVVVAESFAIAVEAIWLARFRVRRAFMWSCVANLSSVSLGFACRSAFGWP